MYVWWFYVCSTGISGAANIRGDPHGPVVGGDLSDSLWSPGASSHVAQPHAVTRQQERVTCADAHGVTNDTAAFIVFRNISETAAHTLTSSLFSLAAGPTALRHANTSLSFLSLHWELLWIFEQPYFTRKIYCHAKDPFNYFKTNIKHICLYVLLFNIKNNRCMNLHHC